MLEKDDRPTDEIIKNLIEMVFENCHASVRQIAEETSISLPSDFSQNVYSCEFLLLIVKHNITGDEP